MSTVEISTERSLYEFGGFRVDPLKRRLLRAGEPVPLTPKAFSILLVLLENRGAVVEKEDLIQRVWPDTYVTEANLTQNVSSLRKALGERANDHRFVVTVPGRGYSFVAEIVEVPRDATAEVQIDSRPSESFLLPDLPTVEGDAPPLSGTWTSVPPLPTEPPPAHPALPPRGRRRFLLAGVVLGLLLSASVLGLYLLYSRPAASARGSAPSVAPRPTVAVMAFRDLSGDSGQRWLVTALAEMLATELSGNPRIRVVSGEEVSRAQQALSLPAAGELSDDNLEQIHSMLGADLVVVGSFLSLGGQGEGRIRIDLRVLRAPGGDVISSRAEVGTEDNLFELVSLLGRRLRHDLGLADPSPEQARAVQALQPGNPEAARLYAEGLARLRAYDPQGARDLLIEAARADPGSAVIRSALSLAWSGLGAESQAQEEAKQAVQLAASLPKQERLAIEARARETEKDWARASEIYRSLWTFYPGLEYGLRLAGSLSSAGRGAEALATVADLRRLPPPAGQDPRIDLAEAQIARWQADPGRELQASRAAADKGRRLAQSQIVGEALLLQGDALYTMGRPGESIARIREARDLFSAAGNQAAVARVLNRMGAVLVDSGDVAAGQARYEEGLAIARQVGSGELIATQLLGMSFAAGYLGEHDRALALAREAYERFSALGDGRATRSLFKVGDSLWYLGDVAAARQTFEEVLERARRSGNPVDESRALDGLGRILAATGSLREARWQQEQAVLRARSAGDPFLAASYLADLGETLMAQGDLTLALRRLSRALESKRKVGDAVGTAEALGRLSRLAYRMGDLVAARRYAAEQQGLGQRMQAKSVSAAALQRLAATDIAVGDLAGARERLDEAARLAEMHGAGLQAVDVHVDQARLALLDGRNADAERLAREAVDWYGRRGLSPGQARALVLSSRTLLARGDAAGATGAARLAHALADHGEDPWLRAAVATELAPFDAASGDTAAALDRLRAAIQESDRQGAVALGLEARCSLGFLEIARGDAAAGRSLVDEVRKEAEGRGFRFLAARAAELLRSAAKGR